MLGWGNCITISFVSSDSLLPKQGQGIIPNFCHEMALHPLKFLVGTWNFP